MHRVIRDEARRQAAQAAADGWGPAPSRTRVEKPIVKPGAGAGNAASDEGASGASQSIAAVTHEKIKLKYPTQNDLTREEWITQFFAKLEVFGIRGPAETFTFGGGYRDVFDYIIELSRKCNIKKEVDTIEWWLDVASILREMNTINIYSVIERNMAEMMVILSRAAEGVPFTEKHIKRKLQMYSMQIELSRVLKAK